MNEKGQGALGFLLVLAVILLLAYVLYVSVLAPMMSQIPAANTGGIPLDGVNQMRELLGL